MLQQVFYYGIQMLLWPWLILPDSIHQRVFRILYTLFNRVKPKIGNRISNRLYLAGVSPALSAQKVLWITYSNAVDMLRFTTGFKAITIVRDNITEFNRIASDNKSHVVYGIHSGAFEYMHMSLSNDHKTTYVIAESFDSYIIDTILHRLRKHPNTIYLTPQEYAGYHKKIISKPSIVAFVIDQSRADPDTAVQINDFALALYTKLIHTLYKRHFEVHPIRSIRKGVRNHTVQLDAPYAQNLTTDQLNGCIKKSVAEQITSYPEQWIWHYPKSQFLKTPTH